MWQNLASGSTPERLCSHDNSDNHEPDTLYSHDYRDKHELKTVSSHDNRNGNGTIMREQTIEGVAILKTF